MPARSCAILLRVPPPTDSGPRGDPEGRRSLGTPKGRPCHALRPACWHPPISLPVIPAGRGSVSGAVRAHGGRRLGIRGPNLADHRVGPPGIPAGPAGRIFARLLPRPRNWNEGSRGRPVAGNSRAFLWTFRNNGSAGPAARAPAPDICSASEGHWGRPVAGNSAQKTALGCRTHYTLTGQ